MFSKELSIEQQKRTRVLDVVMDVGQKVGLDYDQMGTVNFLIQERMLIEPSLSPDKTLLYFKAFDNIPEHITKLDNLLRCRFLNSVHDNLKVKKPSEPIQGRLSKLTSNFSTLGTIVTRTWRLNNIFS